MVALAAIEAGNTVLEPIAGTGRLLDALISKDQTGWNYAPVSRLVAVELNQELPKRLRVTYLDLTGLDSILGFLTLGQTPDELISQ